MHSISLLKEHLIKAKSIAIIGHKLPDADSLSSIISIKRALKNNENKLGEKEIDMFSDCIVIDELYNPIANDEQFTSVPKYDSYDLAICVDCPTPARMGEFEAIFNNAKHTISIDHHETSEHFAENNFIYKCSSTCELIYVILKALNIDPSNDILKLIYAGIITDTVNLTQGTIKVSSYKIVAEIAEKINDIETLNAIKDHFLKNNSKSNLKLLERALHSISFYLDDRVAIMKITGEDLALANASQTDTLGIVNNAINIKGVYIAILFIKQEDGTYYASIRGKNGVDVSTIASELGGGGHETVAAFSHNKNLSELKDDLLSLCKKALPETENDDKDSMFE